MNLRFRGASGLEMADVASVNTEVIVNALGMDEKREEGQRQTPKTQKPTKKR